jgi:hypothetical protein
VLVYWAVLTLGPLFLMGSLAVASYALSASRLGELDVMRAQTADRRALQFS